MCIFDPLSALIMPYFLRALRITLIEPPGDESHSVGDSGIESSPSNAAVFGRHSSAAQPTPPGLARVLRAIRSIALYPLLRYFNQTLLAWVMRRFKRFKGHQIRASHFLQRLATGRAPLFVHWNIRMTPS